MRLAWVGIKPMENRMRNQPGKGPTEQNKATERMAQERASPGATSAETDVRRGDSAAGESKGEGS